MTYIVMADNSRDWYRFLADEPYDEVLRTQNEEYAKDEVARINRIPGEHAWIETEQ